MQILSTLDNTPAILFNPLVLPLNVNIETLLHHEKGRVRPEGLAGVHELEVIVAENSRDDLVDFQEGQVPADADVRTAAELKGKTKMR